VLEHLAMSAAGPRAQSRAQLSIPDYSDLTSLWPTDWPSRVQRLPLEGLNSAEWNLELHNFTATCA
jgi:hypothetical protein